MRKSDDIHGEPFTSRKLHEAQRPSSKTLKEKSEPEIEYSSRDRLLAEAQANRHLAASLIDSDWLGLELLAEIGASSSLPSIHDLERDKNIVPTLKLLVESGLIKEHYGRYSCTKLGREILTKTEKLTGVSMNR